MFRRQSMIPQSKSSYDSRKIEIACRARFDNPSWTQVQCYALVYPKSVLSLKKSTVATMASKFFRSPEAVAMTNKIWEEYRERHRKTADHVIQRLEQMAFADPTLIYDDEGNMLPPHEWPTDVKTLFAGVDVSRMKSGSGEVIQMETAKIKLEKQFPALKALGEHLGLWGNMGPKPSEDPDTKQEESRFDKARRISFLLAQGSE